MKTNLKITKNSGIATTKDGRFICRVTKKTERYWEVSESGMKEVEYKDIDFDHMHELDEIFLTSDRWQEKLRQWNW